MNAGVVYVHPQHPQASCRGSELHPPSHSIPHPVIPPLAPRPTAPLPPFNHGTDGCLKTRRAKGTKTTHETDGCLKRAEPKVKKEGRKTHTPDGCLKHAEPKGDQTLPAARPGARKGLQRQMKVGRGEKKGRKQTRRKEVFVLTLLTQIGNPGNLQSLTQPHDTIIDQSSILTVSRAWSRAS